MTGEGGRGSSHISLFYCCGFFFFFFKKILRVLDVINWVVGICDGKERKREKSVKKGWYLWAVRRAVWENWEIDGECWITWRLLYKAGLKPDRNSLTNLGSISWITYCGAVQIYVVEISVLYGFCFINRKLLEGLWEILRCFGYSLASLRSIFSLCYFGFLLLHGVGNWALFSCIVHYMIFILQLIFFFLLSCRKAFYDYFFFWWSEFFTRWFSVRILWIGCFVGNTVSISLILWNKKRKKKHFSKEILNICYSDRSKGERLGRCCVLPFTRPMFPLFWWGITSFQRSSTCTDSFERATYS